VAVAVSPPSGRLASVNWQLCGGYTRELSSAAIWAGVTTFIWYAVGLVPVQIAVINHFGLTSTQVSSWIFIIWMTGGLASIALSLMYRQPIPITSSIPGLLFLGTVADRFSFPELVGANLMAGILIVILGVSGVATRVLRWLPLPVAMGMLAGSIFGDMSTMVQLTVADGLVPAVTVTGYLIGRMVRQSRVPPIALALVAGAVAVQLAGQLSPQPFAWETPSLVVPGFAFTAPAFVSVSIPLVVLSMGLGQVQGLGFLAAQGYKVPHTATTIVVGLNSVLNALFGGHVAIVSRNGMPIVAGAVAGPPAGRYWANLVASVLSLSIAVAATPVASLLGMLPRGYVVVLAGLAILPSLQNAMERAFGDRLRFAALIAMTVAASPFTLLGLTSAFWALIVSIVVAGIVERDELLTYWSARQQQ
jgi:benzoate membrane transport protein